MKHNEQLFYDFWKENMEGKVHSNSRLITESYFYLHSRPYMGATCGRCLSGVAQDLKNEFLRLKKIKETEEEQQNIQEEINQSLEPVKEVKVVKVVKEEKKEPIKRTYKKRTTKKK